MTAPVQQLLIGATNSISVVGFYDNIAAAYPVDATAVMTLTDASGTAVAGATGLPMPYIAGTVAPNTIYRVILPATLALIAGLYTATVTFTGSGGTGTRPITIPCIAVKP